MLRLVFHQPLRQTEGLLGSLLDLMGVDLPVPDHTTWRNRWAPLELEQQPHCRHAKEWV
jgi:Transposase DDE domain